MKKNENDPLKSRFNLKALRKKHTKKQSLLGYANEGVGYGNLAIGLILLEPLNLSLGLWFTVGGFFNRQNIKTQNQQYHVFIMNGVEDTAHKKRKQVKRKLETFKLKGTIAQIFIAQAAQEEIFRLQSEVDKTPHLSKRKQGENEIQNIIDEAMPDLKSLRVITQDKASKPFTADLFLRYPTPDKRPLPPRFTP